PRGYVVMWKLCGCGWRRWRGMRIGRLIDDIRDALRGVRIDPVETMLWAWTAAIVGFFTLSTFKLDHYVFPAAPALCVLSARAWTDARAATRIGRQLIGPLLIV